MFCCNSRLRYLLAVTVVAAVLTSCGDNTLAPFQPEITSAVDNFQLQATGVKNRTAVLNYDWQNTGTRAKVNHSTSTTAGSARLRISDAVGTVVYDEALVPSLSDTTAVGATGAWKIRLTLNAYSGTLNFRVQKI